MEQGIIDRFATPKVLEEAERLEKILIGIANAIGKANSATTGELNRELTKMVTQTEKLRKTTEEETQASIKARAEKQYMADAIRTATREAKLQEQINNSLKGSYNQLQAQLSKNMITLKAMSEEQRNNAEIGGKLITENAKLNSSLKAIDATMGMHQRNVGNYKSGLYSMSQVMRELPNFAIDARIGFMSLSNNLPMLADDFKRVKESMIEVKDAMGNITMQQAGSKAAWKALASSIFSFNTIMIAGVTLLTLFGDKVVDWIGGLFKADKAVDQLTNSNKQLYDVMQKGKQDAQDEVVKLDLIYAATQDVSKSMKERIKNVDYLQKTYPDYFGNLTDEQILVGKGKKAYDDLTESMYLNAVTRASLDKITENSKKMLELDTAMSWRKREILRLDKAIAETRGNKREEELTREQADAIDKMNISLTVLRGELARMQKGYDAFDASNQNLKAGIKSTTGLLGNQTDENDKQTESINTLKTRSEAWLEILKSSATQSRTAAQQYGALQVAIENLQYQLDTEKFKDDSTALSNLAIEHAATLEKIAKETNDNLSQAPLLDESKKVQTEHATFLENSWKEIQRINNLNSANEKKKLKLDQEDKKKIVQEGLQAITQLYDIFAEHQQYLIDTEKESRLKQLEMNTEAELSNEQLTADQKIDINTAYKAERDAIERKAFEQEKQLKINQVLMDAAVADIRIWSENSALVAAALTLILGATTTASILQIRSQQYPAFEKGGIMDHDGIALVGEKRHELGVTPDGNVFLTPNVPTLMHLQKGTEIYPDASAITSEMIAGLTMKSNVNLSTKALEKKLDKVIEAVKGLKSSESRENLHDYVKFARQYKN